MRLVLDTNVVASALLWSGMPQRLLQAGREKRAELFTSTLLLAELTEILGRRKFNLKISASLMSIDQLVDRYSRCSNTKAFASSESARPCKYLPWLDRTTLWQPEKWLKSKRLGAGARQPVRGTGSWRKGACRSSSRGGLGSENIAAQPHCTNTFRGRWQHNDIAARVHKEDTKDTSVRDYVRGTQIPGVET